MPKNKGKVRRSQRCAPPVTTIPIPHLTQTPPPPCVRWIFSSRKTTSREVKIGVVVKTRMTTRSENSPSKRKAKVRALPPPPPPTKSLPSFLFLPIYYPLTRFNATEYAQVIKMLGNGRLEALCFDGEKRLAHIRGKLRKKVWINQGDIILLSLRDYQDEKGDVILKYSADEARSLKAYGELPESAKINETDTYVLPYVPLGFLVLFEVGIRRALVECFADGLVNLDTAMRVLTTTLSSMKTETGRATTRRLMSMRSRGSACVDFLSPETALQGCDGGSRVLRCFILQRS